MSGEPQTKRWKILVINSGDCKDDAFAQKVFVVTLVQKLVDLNQCPEQQLKSAKQQVQARRTGCSRGPFSHILHLSFMSTFFSEAQECFEEPTKHTNLKPVLEGHYSVDRSFILASLKLPMQQPVI